jgi:hypothetical protein
MGDESWVHHYDPEEKRQSAEYRHPSSPQAKKFKTQPSAKKLLLTVFCIFAFLEICSFK